jgi:hypothetical protein
MRRATGKPGNENSLPGSQALLEEPSLKAGKCPVYLPATPLYSIKPLAKTGKFPGFKRFER